MSDRTAAELREAVADLTAHPLDPRPLGLMTKAADRIEELEASIRDALGRHQVTHIHASLRRVLREDSDHE